MFESLFNTVKGLKACSFIKNSLQHRYFLVKLAKLLRTPSFTEHLWWLLFEFQKTDTRPFSYQKTDTKRNPWVAIYSHYPINGPYNSSISSCLPCNFVSTSKRDSLKDFDYSVIFVMGETYKMYNY